MEVVYFFLSCQVYVQKFSFPYKYIYDTYITCLNASLLQIKLVYLLKLVVSELAFVATAARMCVQGPSLVLTSGKAISAD